MPRVLSIGTAVPPHIVTQEEIQRSASDHFRGGREDVDRLLSVFENVQIRRRHFCVPLDWLREQHTFQERNDLFIQWARALSREAIMSCLERAQVKASSIDQFIFVSTSGVSTPSVDAWLINQLGFQRHIRRTPIFGLGCAGGAAGLARCAQLSQASPSDLILLVSVELSSLTFQPHDFTKSNLIASALFADGAAAVLVTGEKAPRRGVRIVDSQSTIWPDTLDVMGWNFSQTGLQVIFSKSIPVLLRRHIRRNIEALLARNGLQIAGLSHYAVHPGGAKVLESFARSLGLNNGHLDDSRSILEDYGNMSSPTMLFVLERLLSRAMAEPGDYGLGAAFGPGFSAELLLFEWD